MQEQTGKLDVGVAQAIDYPNAVLSENLPGLLRRLAGDQEDRPLRMGLGFVYQLPSCRCVRAQLALNGDGSPVVARPHEGIRAAIGSGWFGDHGQTRDLPEDSERLSFELESLYFHC